MGEVVEGAKVFLEYSDSLGKKESVSVGLAIVGKGGKPLWWQTHNVTELYDLMHYSLDELNFYSSFKGFSVYMQPTWRSYDLSKVKSAPPSGLDIGAWYMDHEVVLNVTKRAAWFKWAEKSKISDVYIAPRATN